MNYYNEIDPQAAHWLRNLIAAGLIPPGDVDERSIEDVTPNELSKYTQCHFFAGIGGWPLALALAGWPVDRPVWTGSCPCQPFSAAGRGDGFADKRHLWPAWLHLIRECKPGVIFGEQVASAVGHGWLDLVSTDLEGQGYACGAAVLGAHSVGAPHIRQRLYFVAYSECWAAKRHGYAVADQARGVQGAARERQWLWAEPRDGGAAGVLANSSSAQSKADGQPGGIHAQIVATGEPCLFGRLSDSVCVRQSGSGRLVRSVSAAKGADWEDDRTFNASRGAWGGAVAIPCADGPQRLIEPSIEPLAYGIPARVVRLRAYGNAIVPQVAAAFIGAFDELGEVRAAA